MFYLLLFGGRRPEKVFQMISYKEYFVTPAPPSLSQLSISKPDLFPEDRLFQIGNKIWN